MGKIALSNPTVVVNNKTLAIIPGSLSYKPGKPGTNVRSVSAGGGAYSTIHTKKGDEAVGMVKFKLAIVTDLDAVTAEYADNTAGNVIFFFEKVGQTVEKRVFEGMSLVTDPEKAISADGEAELEFQGDPMK